MATRLHQILTFANIAPGVHVQAHQLNINDTPERPDLAYFVTDGTITPTVDATTVTVNNTSAGAIDVTVFLFRLHTMERVFGAAQTIALTPQPFIVVGSPGGIAPPTTSTAQRFTYTVTGLEPDLSDFRVPLPAARAATTYTIQVTEGVSTLIKGATLPNGLGDRTLLDFRIILTAVATIGDTFMFTVDDPT